jgi:hypothetical protein
MGVRRKGVPTEIATAAAKIATTGRTGAGFYPDQKITDASMHLGGIGLTMTRQEQHILNHSVMDILCGGALAPIVAEKLVGDPCYNPGQVRRADAPTRAQMYWDSLGLTDEGHQIREAIARQAYAHMIGQPNQSLAEISSRAAAYSLPDQGREAEL